MKILFIGGTHFLGRQTVEDALIQGHNIYILQRGKTNPDLFQNVTKYYGDREKISEILPANDHYDLVVDTCGYHPEIVKKSCQLLKNRTNLYIFISTGSLYADFSMPGLNEQSTTSTLEDIPPISAPITNNNYGPLKTLCEQVVTNTFGIKKSLILRPGIIVGPYDDSKRFDQLIKLIASNKTLDIPSDHQTMIQFIDVRAISHFILSSFDRKRSGTYNVIGPKKPIRLIDFINTAKKLLNPGLELNYIPVDANLNFPMYFNNPKMNGIFQLDGNKAYADGLMDIAIENTIQATNDYLKNLPLTLHCDL